MSTRIIQNISRQLEECADLLDAVTAVPPGRSTPLSYEQRKMLAKAEDNIRKVWDEITDDEFVDEMFA